MRVFTRKKRTASTLVVCVMALLAVFTNLYASGGSGSSGSGGGGTDGGGGGGRALGTLKGLPVPGPDLRNYVSDQKALVALGKALFWDMQTGSDGVQACATCHFNAGADSRSKNTIAPRNTGMFQVGGGPNYQLQLADFPFHKLSVPSQQNSQPLSDTSNVAGSQGRSEERRVGK